MEIGSYHLKVDIAQWNIPKIFYGTVAQFT